jgi:hypothetical protein
MADINFPSPGATGQTYTFNGTTWVYNGRAWVSQITSGSSGTSGINGTSGTSGLKGTSGTSGLGFTSITGQAGYIPVFTSPTDLTGSSGLSWDQTNNLLKLGFLADPTISNAVRTANAGSGLVAGTTYYYCVVAVDVQSNTTNPSATRSATATASTDGITITWTKVTAAAQYWIFRGIGSATFTQYFVITSGNTTSVVDTGVLTYIAGSLPGSNTTSQTYIGGGATGNFNNMTIGFGPANINTNTVLGQLALNSNTVGSGNVAIGTSVLGRIANSTDNVGIGYAALGYLTAGIRNLAIGNSAGRFLSDGVTGLTSANNGIFIGNSTYPKGPTSNNEIIIGASAVGGGSNTTTIGNASTATTQLYGNLVISNTPQATDNGIKLQVNGGIYASGLINAANDAGASASGVPINGLYRNGNIVQIRIV